MIRILAAAVVSLGMAFSAAAADSNSTLRDMDGRVSVNQAPAKLDMRLKPGDKVMVQGKGSATIIFDDQCQTNVEVNKLYVVPEKSACACRLARESKTGTPDSNSTLGKLVGDVSVNEGKAFSPAIPDMRLKPGDRIMVQAKSHATVVFDDKCTLDIDANKLVTVPDESVCACGLLVEQGLNPGAGSAIGGRVISNGAGAAIAGGIIAVELCLDDKFVGERICGGEDEDKDTVSP